MGHNHMWYIKTLSEMGHNSFWKKENSLTD